MVLHEGKVAEMATGEGKTLAALLPAYLNALSGKGVHVRACPKPRARTAARRRPGAPARCLLAPVDSRQGGERSCVVHAWV